MASNAENITWNELYEGARVPVNDTGVPGAPFALSSSDSAWTEGSANKAVYDTVLLNGPFPDTTDKLNAEDGSIDLAHLALYVNSDMLYGYIGDARGKVPGDMMSYRGYPTQVVKDFTLVLDSANSANYINYDGTVGTIGDAIVMKHNLELAHKLPYGSSYIIEYFINTVSKLKIAMTNLIGNVNATAYSIIEIEGVEVLEPVILPLPLEAIYFSLLSDALTGDQTFEVKLVEFSSSNPYYGTIVDQSIIVTEAEYDPGNNWRSLGVSTKLVEPFDMSYYLNTCSEIDKVHLIQGENTELFITASDTLQVGVTLFADNTLIPTAPAGKYIWTTYAYGVIDGVYFRINSYIQLDALGKIVLYYPDVSSIGAMYCAIGGDPNPPSELV